LGVCFIWKLFIITIGGIMGKKKRILFNPKFEHLKKVRFPDETKEEKPVIEDTPAPEETKPLTLKEELESLKSKT